MLKEDELTQIRLQLHFDFAVSNCNGKIWVFLNDDLSCYIVKDSNQCHVF